MARRSLPIQQIASFGLVGLIVTLVNIVIYWIGAESLGADPNLAWCAGFAVAVVLGFVLQRRFVFAPAQQVSALASGSRYLAVALLAFAVNSFWVWFTVTWMDLPTWAPVPLTIFATPVMTYLLNRYWVFR